MFLIVGNTNVYSVNGLNIRFLLTPIMSSTEIANYAKEHYGYQNDSNNFTVPAKFVTTLTVVGRTRRNPRRKL